MRKKETSTFLDHFARSFIIDKLETPLHPPTPHQLHCKLYVKYRIEIGQVPTIIFLLSKDYGIESSPTRRVYIYRKARIIE